MSKKILNYSQIIRKHNLKLSKNRIEDFRSTLKEIINVKNGILPRDASRPAINEEETSALEKNLNDKLENIDKNSPKLR